MRILKLRGLFHNTVRHLCKKAWKCTVLSVSFQNQSLLLLFVGHVIVRTLLCRLYMCTTGKRACLCVFLQRSRQVRQVYTSVRWHDLTFPSVLVNGNKQAKAPPEPHDLNMTWVGESAVGGGWAKSLPSARFFFFLLYLSFLFSRRRAESTLLITWWELEEERGVECGRHLNKAFRHWALFRC